MRVRTVVVSSAVIVVAAVTLAALSATSKKVEVQYVGGEQCVDYPEEVTIYTDRAGNLFKPRKVKWVVDKDLGFEWTFAYDAYKGGNSGENLLGGPFVIEPGKKSVKSGKSTSAGNWYYEIIVDDPEGEGCSLDPLIVIDR